MIQLCNRLTLYLFGWIYLVSLVLCQGVSSSAGYLRQKSVRAVELCMIVFQLERTTESVSVTKLNA